MSTLKMLQRFDNYFSSWLAAILLIFMAVLMIVLGLYNPQNQVNTKKTAIISIRNKIIDYDTFDRYYQRLKRQYQFALDKTAQSNAEHERTLQMQALAILVNKTVLYQHLYQQGYRIHPKDTVNTLHRTPAFQRDGQFSLTRFEKLIASEGYTRELFLSELEIEKLIEQNRKAVTKSAFVTKNEIENTKHLIHQRRKFDYLKIPARFFQDTFKEFSTDEIKNYYHAHLTEFRLPEQVSIEYILVSLQDIVKKLSVELPKKNAEQIKIAAENKFAEIVHSLSHLSYIQPMTLVPIARSLGTALHSTQLFDRSGSKDSIARFPEVTTAAFSQNVLKGYNSDVISIDSNCVIVLRLKKHQPLRLINFSEAKENIVQKLQLEKSKEKVAKVGKALVQKLNTHPVQTQKLPYAFQWSSTGMVKRHSKVLPSDILNAGFKIPSQEKKNTSNTVGFATTNGNYMIVRLVEVDDQLPNQLTTQSKTTSSSTVATTDQEFEYDLYTQKILKRAAPLIKQLQ